MRKAVYVLYLVTIIFSIVARVKMTGYIKDFELKNLGIASTIIGVIGGGISLILAGIFSICASKNNRNRIDYDNFSNNDSL